MTADDIIFTLWEYRPTAIPIVMSFQNSSSAQHSVVRLEQPRSQYCVGDTLNVLVEMRNYGGHPKAYGGDFILARVHSPKLHASASGEVTDLLNGSYRVHFHLFWPGELQVSVLLIHSSEAVQILQRDWMLDYGKAVHKGTFINGSKNESSHCGLRLITDRPLCEYKKKEDGEYFACYQPKTLPCSSLSTMQSYTPRTKEEPQLLARQNVGIQIQNNFPTVTVIGCAAKVHKPTEKCVAGMNSPFPGGYFYSNSWSSSFCQTRPFISEDAITRCLKGKTVYLFGDSTMRQWIEYLEKLLKGLKFIQQADPANAKLAVDAHSNITIWWKKHAHPWISSQSVTNIKILSIPEELDSIAVGGRTDVVVVIGVGQHFRPYPPEVFIRRLLSMRRAILRLQARSPQAQVVIKLENTKELTSMMSHSSDWYGYMNNQSVRKVFEGLKVVLVDAWDMTVAANSFAIHPNNIILSNDHRKYYSFFWFTVAGFFTLAERATLRRPWLAGSRRFSPSRKTPRKRRRRRNSRELTRKLRQKLRWSLPVLSVGPRCLTLRHSSSTLRASTPSPPCPLS
ncbi:hypothetical protein AAFF_G00196070 [Aldrovandia affinis]|uniref:NXPE C-terminal domain-containing protein n=1 Tax=Aldrovandia affinis TaxID=143900 RepID=A0AAD7W5E4_9TELE|nr:hypothetical protein AAFF_G00196070 [Aldrovandia affinis]